MPTINNSALKIFRGDSTECAKRPIIDRQFLIDLEARCFYVDVKNRRLPFGKNVDIDTEAIWKAIHEIEDKYNDSTISMTVEEIEKLVNTKIEDIINSSDSPINSKIKEIDSLLTESKAQVELLTEKLEKIDTIEEEIQTVNQEIAKIQEEKQATIFSINDVLYADKWDIYDDGDSFIHEYYYTNDAIPDGAVITAIPSITNSDEYANVSKAGLFSAIDYDIERKLYIFRCINIPDNDIDVFITVTPQSQQSK